MALVGSVLFVVLAFIIGYSVGGIFLGVLAAIGVVAWFRFSIGQATVGLYESNLAAYWGARSAGASHRQAIEAVIASRYRLSPARLAKVRSEFDESLAWMSPIANDVEREASEIKMLIWIIFCSESGTPPTKDLRDRTVAQIDDAYAVGQARFARAQKPHTA